MIAITGAAGLIGSNLAHRLATLGAGDLILVDHPITASKAANLAGLPAFRFLEHTPFLEALEAGRLAVDAIFHLGACSDTQEQDWDYLLRNNVMYSQALWKWCAEHGKPLIYASSAATYGDGSHGFDDETHPEVLRPLNLYARSKNEFDLWALARLADGRRAPASWAGLKFFNVYGPREGHKGRMASMVWHSYLQIRDRGEVGLFRSTDPSIRDGCQLRDFVYVGDCVDHMLWLWRNPGVRGIFNSGTGRARTFLDLASLTFRALGREPKVRFIDMPREMQAGYQSYTQARMAKLRAAGYAGPTTALEEGIGRYVDWLESQAGPDAPRDGPARRSESSRGPDDHGPMPVARGRFWDTDDLGRVVPHESRNGGRR